jgi:hypothetical protein
VELRIFESDPGNDMHKTDITFAYNANFFLFATLDTARPIAQGRVSGQPPTCPVLTGVPVAGIAYLDRPAQAGYFIFPDLSVRHEGIYRLNFNLYEEVKDAKDADQDTPLPSPESLAPSSKPTAPKSFLHFRLEVKSLPFTVYSAKKFPGLATSTALSRVVAEQGCRVRIRRDVRMRRRGDKGNKDYDEDRMYPRSPRYATPDAYVSTPIERPRSTSISTVDGPFPYGPDAPRRPSIPEYAYQAPPPPAPYQNPAGAAAVPPAHGPGYQSHLSFGSAHTQYQTPQLPPTPQAAPPTPTYSAHPSLPHSRNSSTMSEYEPSSSQSYSYPPSRPQADRTEYSKSALPLLHLDSLPSVNREHRPSEPSGYPPTQAPGSHDLPTKLPPIRCLHDEPPAGHERPSASQRLLYDTDTLLTKRSHQETFGHEERPLQNGMRPDSETQPTGIDDRKRDLMEPRWEGSPSMEYRRADGSMSTKVRQTTSSFC